MNLLSPAALARGWPGCAATLLLDLGEGAWPAAPGLPPDLDEERRSRINAALRQAPFASGFPPSLQTFRLPRAEEDETLPRAFHAEAFGFNAALALTREGLVALLRERFAVRDGKSRPLDLARDVDDFLGELRRNDLLPDGSTP